eukprot:3887126-Amphidinium_carterae.1
MWLEQTGNLDRLMQVLTWILQPFHHEAEVKVVVAKPSKVNRFRSIPAADGRLKVKDVFSQLRKVLRNETYIADTERTLSVFTVRILQASFRSRGKLWSQDALDNLAENIRTDLQYLRESVRYQTWWEDLDEALKQ